MAYLSRDGVRIYYEDHGEGPVVLLSHGYSSASPTWQDQVAAFNDRYRVIVWDMRGHGKSDYPDDQALYSEAHMVADMAALLDECGLESAVIAGLSLGGVASLAFHLAHPERCRALMLFDTGPGFKKEAPRNAWNDRAAKRGDDFDRDGLSALGKGAEKRASWHRDASGLARAARGMLAQEGDHHINSLPDISIPTLVLAGVNDEPFLAATDYMAAKIPNAVKAMIPDAGHSANLDNPEAFNRAVGDFLDGLAA